MILPTFVLQTRSGKELLVSFFAWTVRLFSRTIFLLCRVNFLCLLAHISTRPGDNDCLIIATDSVWRWSFTEHSPLFFSLLNSLSNDFRLSYESFPQFLQYAGLGITHADSQTVDGTEPALLPSFHNCISFLIRVCSLSFHYANIFAFTRRFFCISATPRLDWLGSSPAVFSLRISPWARQSCQAWGAGLHRNYHAFLRVLVFFLFLTPHVRSHNTVIAMVRAGSPNMKTVNLIYEARAQS